MATGPNTSGRFHAGLPPQRAAAGSTWSFDSGESEPAKSTCLAMNCVTPAPEPVGLYDSVLPEHVWPHTWLNTAIAFCWAVEPSAVSEALPPQSAADAEADVDAEPEPDALEDGVAVLLSLPHAVSVEGGDGRGSSAIPSGLPSTLAKAIELHLSHFQIDGFRTPRQRMPPSWTAG